MSALLDVDPLDQPASVYTVAAAVAGPGIVSPETMQRLRQHRTCASGEDASLVRRLCMSDRTVLPRWHQDDRGIRNAHKREERLAPAGAYSDVVSWRSRQHWAEVVVPWVADQHADQLKAAHVSRHLFCLMAQIKSGYAQDQRTGRRCIVRPDTIAAVLGLTTARQVKKVNALYRALGLEIVVMSGGMLNEAERYACHNRGSRQRGWATEVGFTEPADFRRAQLRPVDDSVDSFTPTRGRTGPRQTCSSLQSLHGLAAESRDATASRTEQTGSQRRKRGRHLAAEVRRRVPWLAPDGPGRLAPALMRFANAADPWTADDIVAVLDDHSTRTGLGPITSDRIRTRPSALLASIVRELDVQADHPNLDPFPTASSAVPVAENADPCGSADCDHGWIEDERGRVAACADCPPIVRSNYDPYDDLGNYDPENPPF